MRARAFETPQSIRRALRLGLAAGLLGAGAWLSGCSTVQGILTGKDTVAAADAAPGAKEPYPTLGGVPDRPVVSDTPEERREIAEGLVADRERIQYSDQLLRGGNDIPAPPPPAPVASAASVTPAPAAPKEPSVLKSGEDDGPGFFGRLFGRTKTVVTDEPAALSAQPTGTVEVTPAPGAPADGAQGPTIR